LKEELSRYFPIISNKLFPLVKSPFTFDFDEISEIAQEELIEMINDTGIKSEFSSFSETQFWVRRFLDYPKLSKPLLYCLFQTTNRVKVSAQHFIPEIKAAISSTGWSRKLY
jgi:hypothetical protein